MIPPHELAPPDALDVAFKEWAAVCEALISGRQSLILRKGGIDEGPGGFRPEHPAFWLFPTHWHEASQGVRADATVSSMTIAPRGLVPLRGLAVVTTVNYIDRPEILPRLADLHVWTEETVLKRFHYRRPGLWLVGVRVYSRPEPWLLEPTPEQAGCKTWVHLDAPLATGPLEASLSVEAHAAYEGRLKEALTPAVEG